MSILSSQAKNKQKMWSCHFNSPSTVAQRTLCSRTCSIIVVPSQVKHQVFKLVFFVSRLIMPFDFLKWNTIRLVLYHFVGCHVRVFYFLLSAHSTVKHIHLTYNYVLEVRPNLERMLSRNCVGVFAWCTRVWSFFLAKQNWLPVTKDTQSGKVSAQRALTER